MVQRFFLFPPQGIVMTYLMDREDEAAENDDEEETGSTCFPFTVLSDLQSELLLSLIHIVVLIAIGTVGFIEIEGVSFVKAF